MIDNFHGNYQCNVKQQVGTFLLCIQQVNKADRCKTNVYIYIIIYVYSIYIYMNLSILNFYKHFSLILQGHWKNLLNNIWYGAAQCQRIGTRLTAENWASLSTVSLGYYLPNFFHKLNIKKQFLLVTRCSSVRLVS